MFELLFWAHYKNHLFLKCITIRDAVSQLQPFQRPIFIYFFFPNGCFLHKEQNMCREPCKCIKLLQRGDICFQVGTTDHLQSASKLDPCEISEAAVNGIGLNLSHSRLLVLFDKYAVKNPIRQPWRLKTDNLANSANILWLILSNTLVKVV